MFISQKWLKDFVSFPKTMTPEQFCCDLTLHTVEVEGAEEQTKQFDAIVVGVIQTVRVHKNADKLRVCDVDIGESKTIQIVCGGLHLEEGQKVVVAKVGASVKWHGEGKSIILKKAIIRGVESYGMICASSEVGLAEYYPTEDEREIIDLGDLDAPAGMNLGKALGLDDVIFDVDNKSMTNRPDLWGQYGMAREVSAIYGVPLKAYSPKEILPVTRKDATIDLSVTVDATDVCSRYLAVAVDGVSVGSSPTWMQKRLSVVGIRPINMIVDITNYVMMEIGQPMHAFDTEYLGIDKKRHIIVRKAEKGEKFIAVDGKKYVLTTDMLVIADYEKVVALAGIIGGKNSEIIHNTKTILFEAATFDAVCVRRTAQALGIRTESSARFEKSLDSVTAMLALKRAVELTLQLCPNANVVSDVVDIKQKQQSAKPILVSLKFLERKIGIKIERKKIISILERLGFGVKEKNDIFIVTVPSWRATKDVSIPEDIVEEVARMYGYDAIPSSLPQFEIVAPEQDPLRLIQTNIRRILSLHYALTEIQNYSFVSLEWLTRIGIDTKNYIELDNPIAKDRSLLRRRLVPNMLQNIEKNAHQFDSIRLFEIGKTFFIEEKGELMCNDETEYLPKQETHLAIVNATKENDVPFYDVSVAVQGLCEYLGIPVYLKQEKLKEDVSFLHPGRFAYIMIDEQQIGYIAELHPVTQDALGIPYRTSMAEINLEYLVTCSVAKKTYQPLPQYPAVERDVAIVVDKTVRHADIVSMVSNINPLVELVQLFDVYVGKGVPKGQKSMAYHITYRSEYKTLESVEVDKIHATLLQKLSEEFGAEVRK